MFSKFAKRPIRLWTQGKNHAVGRSLVFICRSGRPRSDTSTSVATSGRSCWYR